MGLFTVDTLSAYGDSASDRQMDASSKLTNIVDQSVTVIKVAKVYVFVLC